MFCHLAALSLALFTQQGLQAPCCGSLVCCDTCCSSPSPVSSHHKQCLARDRAQFPDHSLGRLDSMAIVHPLSTWPLAFGWAASKAQHLSTSGDPVCFHQKFPFIWNSLSFPHGQFTTCFHALPVSGLLSWRYSCRPQLLSLFLPTGILCLPAQSWVHRPIDSALCPSSLSSAWSATPMGVWFTFCGLHSTVQPYHSS